MGYPEGREPRYYWNKEQLGDGILVGIEAVVPTSGGDPTWGGWVYESRGTTPFHGASRAAFAVLRDIMERFPQELAYAFAGVFPQGDPYTSVSDQSEVNALERSADEDQHSDSTDERYVHLDEDLWGSGALLRTLVRVSSHSAG